VSELFSNILDYVQFTFQHLANSDFSTLVILAGAVIVVGILIFRR
jgi:hypothetical protein